MGEPGRVAQKMEADACSSLRVKSSLPPPLVSASHPANWVPSIRPGMMPGEGLPRRAEM